MKTKYSIKERVAEVAQYIIHTNKTIRETAKTFEVSKSTIHLDCSKRLIHVSKELFAKVRKILDEHLSERAMRGGNATRSKWMARNEAEEREEAI